jgi:hypothetical protein
MRGNRTEKKVDEKESLELPEAAGSYKLLNVRAASTLGKAYRSGCIFSSSNIDTEWRDAIAKSQFFFNQYSSSRPSKSFFSFFGNQSLTFKL